MRATNSIAQVLVMSSQQVNEGSTLSERTVPSERERDHN
jgi:hypothetical protein